MSGWSGKVKTAGAGEEAKKKEPTEAFYIDKPDFIKVGVIAYFDSPNADDIREISIKTALLNTIPDVVEFTGTDQLVDPDGLAADYVEPTTYSGRKSETEGETLLTNTEVVLAGKRDGICIIFAMGNNPQGEKCFAYFSIRTERINSLVRQINRGRITPSEVGRVVHQGMGSPTREDMEMMFDNWLFTARKTTIKYIARKAGGE